MQPFLLLLSCSVYGKYNQNTVLLWIHIMQKAFWLSFLFRALSLSCQYRRQVIKIRRLRGFQLLRCYHPLFIILVCVLNCHIANNAQASLHSKPSMMKAQTNEFHDCLARPFRMKFCRENQNKKAAHKIVQYKSMFELPCQTLAFRRCNDCYVNNCQPTSFSKKVSFNI